MPPETQEATPEASPDQVPASPSRSALVAKINGTVNDARPLICFLAVLGSVTLGWSRLPEDTQGRIAEDLLTQENGKIVLSCITTIGGAAVLAALKIKQ